jgi:Ser/Thr protein kinase RdoA (MazF antagonist)
MIEGLERALVANGWLSLRDLGCSELESALGEALGGQRSAKLVAQATLKPRVFRLRFDVHGQVRSLIAKRMGPGPARRNELVIRRWLPDLGLHGVAPELLGIAAGRAGRWVWHVYEDLGPWELDTREPDLERVAAVVGVIASLHQRFAAHPVLAECRLHGESPGFSYCMANVHDALHGLELLRPPRVRLSPEQAEVRDRLLERLRRLADEEPTYARALAEWGGPETFLHGDLWASNAFAQPAVGGPRVRLIDWDHAGVGPASYDLSTFLLRFAPAHRLLILSLYRQALEGGPWRMPGPHELNILFEMAECARYANRAVWPAIALLRDRAEWAFAELAAVESWFESFEPVLPEEPA